MLYLIGGILIGILLSLIAILVGKKFATEINSQKMPFEKQEMASIIRLEDDLTKILKDNDNQTLL
jgi:hypothetical protein